MSQAFAVVIEETDHNFSAYVPDLPGCVATGPTRGDVLAEIRGAIAFHLDGLAADAQPQPPVRSSSNGASGSSLSPFRSFLRMLNRRRDPAAEQRRTQLEKEFALLDWMHSEINLN